MSDEHFRAGTLGIGDILKRGVGYDIPQRLLPVAREEGHVIVVFWIWNRWGFELDEAGNLQRSVTTAPKGGEGVAGTTIEKEEAGLGSVVFRGRDGRSRGEKGTRNSSIHG